MCIMFILYSQFLTVYLRYPGLLVILLRQIRRHAGKEVTTQLVIAFITSRLAYYNSVLAGLRQVTQAIAMCSECRCVSHSGTEHM